MCGGKINIKDVCVRVQYCMPQHTVKASTVCIMIIIDHKNTMMSKHKRCVCMKFSLNNFSQMFPCSASDCRKVSKNLHRFWVFSCMIETCQHLLIQQSICTYVCTRYTHMGIYSNWIPQCFTDSPCTFAALQHCQMPLPDVLHVKE